MPKVTFYPEGKSGEVPSGTSLLDAADKLGISINHDCGGFATCSTCRILIVEGASHLTEIDLDEENMLEEAELPAPFRLSCQAKIHGDVVTRIPDAEMKWDQEALQHLEKQPVKIRQMIRLVAETQARKKEVSTIDSELSKLLIKEAMDQIESTAGDPNQLSALIKQAYEIP
ncbi:MAG: 2Fe-2S iron-sulfur cluster-binding protein [Nitrospiria bacterium]